MAQPPMNHGAEEWGSDFFGGLNELPPEPVAGIGQVLDTMATLPAFRDARLTHRALPALAQTYNFQIIDVGSGYCTILRGINNRARRPNRIMTSDMNETRQTEP
jgi:hypothetical protein